MTTTFPVNNLVVSGNETVAGNLSVAGTVSGAGFAAFAPSVAPTLTGPVTITGTGSGEALTVGDATNPSGLLIELIGNGATTPDKFLQVANGSLAILNSTSTADALVLSDSGVLSVAAGSGVAPVGMVVTSIAALRTVKKTQTPNVFVAGYYASGDGGGGNYWYNAADTSSGDNGGTVIVAADGGRWYLDYTDYVMSKQFGCKADGVTDDTTTLNAAFTYSSYLKLSAGVHVISAQVSKAACSNFILEGQGMQSIIQTNSATANILVFGDGTNQYQNVTLRNFGIVSSVAKSAGSAIIMLLCARSIIQHVEACPPEYYTSGSPHLYGGLQVQNFDDMKVEACTFITSFYGILMFGSTNQAFGDDFYIYGGTRINCPNTASTGLWISGGCGGVTVESVDIIGCGNNVVIDQSTTAAPNRELFFGPGCAIDSAANINFWVKANGAATIVMTGTWCSSAGLTTASGVGIQVDNPQATAGLALQCSNMKIFNNSGGGITINGGEFMCTNGYITSNGTGSGGGQGILLGNSAITGATIVGNTILNNGIVSNGEGLLIVSGVANTQVQCNTIRGNAQGQLVDSSGAVNKLIQNNLLT